MNHRTWLTAKAKMNIENGKREKKNNEPEKMADS